MTWDEITAQLTACTPISGPPTFLSRPNDGFTTNYPERRPTWLALARLMRTVTVPTEGTAQNFTHDLPGYVALAKEAGASIMPGCHPFLGWRDAGKPAAVSAEASAEIQVHAGRFSQIATACAAAGVQVRIGYINLEEFDESAASGWIHDGLYAAFKQAFPTATLVLLRFGMRQFDTTHGTFLPQGQSHTAPAWVRHDAVSQYVPWPTDRGSLWKSWEKFKATHAPTAITAQAASGTFYSTTFGVQTESHLSMTFCLGCGFDGSTWKRDWDYNLEHSYWAGTFAKKIAPSSIHFERPAPKTPDDIGWKHLVEWYRGWYGVTP